MSSPEEGGTKIRRNSPPPEMPPPPPPQMPPPPQVDPREDMMQQQMLQQQMMQQQMMQQQPQGYQQPPQQNAMGPTRGILKKSTFGGKSTFSGAFDSPTLKYTLLVIVIFMLLNSKFIWKQIMHFPLMGSAEPSVVALIVNSVIAGMAFYLISSFLIKN
uniref:Uncharacterized protein n=1 Tax=viral metagenome TaxID=1070528 RepID=A0A6C0B0U3_9ZZZZ